jgi:hypothetical protein
MMLFSAVLQLPVQAAGEILQCDRRHTRNHNGSIMVVNVWTQGAKTENERLGTIAVMKTAAMFALTFLRSLQLAFCTRERRGGRALVAAYLKTDADVIALGVKEQYTLTNSISEITTPRDDIAGAKETIRNTKSSRIRR